MSTHQEMCGPRCGHELKATFPVGPWSTEPDRVEFEHAGMPCLLHRNGHLGHWCGYVGVAPGHPAHGKSYDDIDVEVHGGLTYAAACEPPICHVPKPGQPDALWWMGFDAAHCWDLAPGIRAALAKINISPLTEYDRQEVYRDMAYMRAETERLAEQLAAMIRPDAATLNSVCNDVESPDVPEGSKSE